VNNKELYDLKADRGETVNLIDSKPEVVAKLRAAYEQWWTDILPMQVNENATAPKVNPMKALYWEQLGGGPDEALKKFMDPATTTFGEGGRRKPAAK
jgi:arylsulfatase